MTKALLTLSFAVTLADSQALTNIRPVTPGASPATTLDRHMEAARPLLGYVTDGSNVLRTVIGAAGSPPLWGEPLALPDSTAAAFLPPRQEYVLLASNAGLSVARLSRSTVYPGAAIPNAMPQPEKVAFSPSGEAAVLFSTTESRLDVITYVAGEGQLRWSLPIADPGELRQFTISDDGELLVATFANQPAVYSWHGTAWQRLATNYTPNAWAFLPHSYDLILSDRTQKTIVVLPEAGRPPITARVLASGVGMEADLLQPNKQGTKLLAVLIGTSTLWSIDLAAGAIAPLRERGNIDSLTLLRDGQTFLISTKTSPVVVKLSGDTTESVATNNPAR